MGLRDAGAGKHSGGCAMNMEYFRGGKIVSLHPVHGDGGFGAIGRVEAYWEGLRDGRLMPTRAEVDPRGIADALEQAFILEKIAPGMARVRLAGRHLNDLMAMEVRGMPVSALFLPEARREVSRVLHEVMDTPAVVRLSLASARGFGRAPLTARMILLPLRDGHGAPTRVFGALQASGRIGRGPARFTLRDVETSPIKTARAHRPVRADFARVSAVDPTPRPKPVTDAPTLRLVHDADRA